MFSVVLLTPLISLSILLAQYYSWRRAILSAATIWGIVVVISTEVLSIFRQFSFFPLVITWIIFNLLILGRIFFTADKKQNRIPNFSVHWLAKVQKQQFLAGSIFAIVTIIIIIGIIALAAPPNTWDSMTYHMSRVVHWIQNRSIAFYPTYNLPQLFHPPFAEYVIAHLQILSGTDRYANLVQWLTLIGSAIAVSSIALELNANARGQVFAAVFAVTIPMGILQASSTQNDYAVSFWVLCLAYYVLLSIKYGTKKTSYFFIGASLGLAILTKSSGYLYAFAFMVWYSLAQFKKWGWRGWQPIFIPSAIALVLNLNHYLRNYSLFQSFISAPDNFASAYKIEIISIPTFISNVLRNLALHTDVIRNLKLENFIYPTTGIVNKALLLIHDFLGVDMYDPRTTANSYRGVPGISFDENVAGNPLHLVFIVIAIFFFLLFKSFKKDRLIKIYILASSTGFIFVCLLLKIQIYQSRHHLALFLLLSSIVGIALARIPIQQIANLLVILLIVTSLPWVFQNKFRPIVAEQNIFNTPRMTQYFINRPQLEPSYTEAARTINNLGCEKVGLSLGRGITVGNEYWEYPLWTLLKAQNPQIELQHIQPENVSNSLSNRYPHKNFMPCAIIAIRQNPELPVKQINFKNRIYRETWAKQPVNVLVP